MDKQGCQVLLAKIRTERSKQAQGAGGPAPLPPPVDVALADTAAADSRAEALRRMGHLSLAALGVGAAARGALGLLNHFRRQVSSETSPAGPALLPLPYPVEPQVSPEEVADPDKKRRKAAWDVKQADPAGGTPSPMGKVWWYGPGMMLAGLGGLAGGWKGVDMILAARRQREREDELAQSRQEFHEALLGQYAKPLGGKAIKGAQEKSAAMLLGEELDNLFESRFAGNEKSALFGIDLSSLGNHIANYYGMYAVPAALASGAIVYNKAQGRSRRALIEKALQKRQKKRFEQSPTEIYAIPEPVESLPKTPFREEMAMLTHDPGSQ